MKTKEQILTSSAADITLLETFYGVPKSVTSGILRAMDTHADQVAQGIIEELG